MSSEPPSAVLHYTGYTHSCGGILAVIRGMSRQGLGRVVHGVSANHAESGAAELELWRGPRIEGDRIDLFNFGRALVVARAVRVWMAEEPGRIFHGHSRAGLLVALWLRLWGEHRVVVSVHCYGRQRWFYRLAARILGRRLVWLTPAMKKYYYGTVASDWAGCVPNSLPGEPAAELRRRPAGRPLRLGGAGIMVPGKNWEMILRALAELPAGTEVDYYHAGGPLETPDSQKYAQELRQLAEVLGVSSRVHWLGWLPSTAAWWNQVDLLVVPSGHEAFSMSALEALWAGVPVIAVRGGGPDDLVRTGVNGWLVDSEEASLLAQQLQRCLDPGIWPERRADREHLHRFHAAAVAAQWRQVYATL